MASSEQMVDLIVAQASSAGDVSARKMFGEYGLYLDGKIVGLICDDRLFVKATSAGRDFCGEVEEAPPYPGAKPSLLIDRARVSDARWISELIAITAAALPAPKKKRSRPLP
jgi:DNA transformation protein and related proteins